MDKGKLKFVLSTAGISVLLNTLDQSESALRKRLTDAANLPSLEHDLEQQVDALAERALERLKQGNTQQNRSLSAELNGLYGIYGDVLPDSTADFHYLIATDTALGKKAAEVIRDFLKAVKFNVDIYVPKGLSTADPLVFSSGIKDLIKWCEEIIPGYRDKNYRIVFNLTGAFKSLQGHLSIMGMFYADEIVYIFEAGSQLLRIPRLPLQIDAGALRKYRAELAMMAQGHVFPLERVHGIPDGLLETDKQSATLSSWGELVWKRTREQLLGEELAQFPRLCHEDKFRKDFESVSKQERIRLQETLAKAAGVLEDHNGDTSALKQDGGLKYEVYEGKHTKDGKPIGHFRVSDSYRVTCTADGGKLYLRRYGDHSVNDNP
jgi:putative CRISPR-associated protein (TIGR02619 family)